MFQFSDGDRYIRNRILRRLNPPSQLEGDIFDSKHPSKTFVVRLILKLSWSKHFSSSNMVVPVKRKSTIVLCIDGFCIRVMHFPKIAEISYNFSPYVIKVTVKSQSSQLHFRFSTLFHLLRGTQLCSDCTASLLQSDGQPAGVAVHDRCAVGNRPGRHTTRVLWHQRPNIRIQTRLRVLRHPGRRSSLWTRLVAHDW